jgi:hypothetical protein
MRVPRSFKETSRERHKAEGQMTYAAAGALPILVKAAAGQLRC